MWAFLRLYRLTLNRLNLLQFRVIGVDLLQFRVIGVDLLQFRVIGVDLFKFRDQNAVENALDKVSWALI
jgi:hypothetical protein